jgi:hypothetical protein
MFANCSLLATFDRNVEVGAMVPLYGARIKDLGPDEDGVLAQGAAWSGLPGPARP